MSVYRDRSAYGTGSESDAIRLAGGTRGDDAAAYHAGAGYHLTAGRAAPDHTGGVLSENSEVRPSAEAGAGGIPPRRGPGRVRL